MRLLFPCSSSVAIIFFILFVQFVPVVDELTSKSNSLEQELGRANKTIQKSKKAVEVQQLLKENQSLNLKLSTQDEDFRLQNQTLLQELSKVKIIGVELAE